MQPKDYETSKTNPGITTKHLSFQSISDLNNLCKPLFDSTDIGSIAYARYYHDNSCMALNTYSKMHELLYIEKKGALNIDLNFLNLIHKNTSPSGQKFKHGKIICPLDDCLPCFATMRHELGLSSFLGIMEKHIDYFDAFGFSSTTGKHLYSFYFSHFDILEQFMLYFKEQGQTLIAQNEKHKIFGGYRNDEYRTSLNNFKKHLNIEDNKITKLKQQLQLKKYPIIHNSQKIYITQQTLKCLNLLAHGYSGKCIGKNLAISPRTVETHINNLKSKLGVNFKTQLVDIFYKNDLVS